MKNILFVFAILAVLAGATGCEKKEVLEQPPSTDPRVGQISMSPAQQGAVEAAGSATATTARLSPLEVSQNEYLDAYNEYVRLLRESGPQTIETLQALAVYQKKYQIFQMLLKAQGDKTP